MKNASGRTLAVLSMSALLGGTAVGASASTASASVELSRYVVQYNSVADIATQSGIVRREGGRVNAELRNVFPGAVLDLTPAQAERLRKSGRTKVVERDQRYATTASQSGASYGLDRIDQRDLPLSGSYDYTNTGAGVTAYVVDTGVLSSHQDLAGRVGAGYTAINDGRGTEDCNGHGTHVAGTVAGTVYGVAKQATVVPVRVLGCDGSGSTSGIITALDWIVGHHQVGAPAVANMSLGGGASSTLDSAVGRAVADGVTVVVAAGNSNTDACSTSPARAASAITVGATTDTDARASYSNFGSCLDVFAPGSNIRSAYHTSSTATATLSGTSMASPHVAGVAALALQSAPAATPADVSAGIVSSSTPNKVGSAGSGSPNRLLYSVGGSAPAPAPTPTPTPTPVPAATAPSAPSNVVAATSTVGAASVTWTRGSDGGSPLTRQTITIYRYGLLSSSVVGTVTVDGSASSANLTGLRSGSSHAFSVSATNSVGTSGLSPRSNRITVR